MDDFDPSIATRQEIDERRQRLIGRNLQSLAIEVPRVARVLEKNPTKGQVGLLIEAYFHIQPNPSPLPDFPAAGIELKTVPLKQGPKKLKVEERTVVGMIDYEALVGQVWETSSAKRKLDCLLVFVEEFDDRLLGQFVVRDACFWTPTSDQEAGIRRDWQVVQDKVRAGLAHELSESDGVFMGPCTKGVKGTDLTPQPHSSILAKPRAFALKQSFMREVFLQRDRSAEPFGEFRAESLEGDVSRALGPFVGGTIGDLARRLGMSRGTSKDFGARVIRLALGAPEGRVMPPVFRLMGLTPKAPRVNRSMLPYESISFPSFKHEDLLREEWEDSELLAQLEYMVFVPCIGAKKATPFDECVVAAPRFWRPTAASLDVIRKEWEQARERMVTGRLISPLKSSETEALHVRPHGANGRDMRVGPGGTSVVKQCFWLNRRFVQEILLGRC